MLKPTPYGNRYTDIIVLGELMPTPCIRTILQCTWKAGRIWQATRLIWNQYCVIYVRVSAFLFQKKSLNPINVYCSEAHYKHMCVYISLPVSNQLVRTKESPARKSGPRGTRKLWGIRFVKKKKKNQLQCIPNIS